MPLHYSRDGYTFQADSRSLAIEPGPKPITLTRPELEQLGLDVRDEHRIPLAEPAADRETVTEAILSALSETMRRCRGPEEAWLVMNLKRAMTLIGGLDEEMVQDILDQEGV